MFPVHDCFQIQDCLHFYLFCVFQSRKKYDDYDKEMKDMTSQQQSLEKSNAEMR